MTIKNAIMAVLAVQSSTSSLSDVERAAVANTRIFIAYVIVLILAAVGTVVFTVWMFRSSGRLQDAIKADADARIEEARLETKKVDERAKRLELQLEESRAEVLKLDTQLRDVEKRQAPRRLGFRAFKGVLSGHPTITIWHKPNDGEAAQFARDLFFALSEAEWIVDKLDPVPDDVVGEGLLNGPPEALKKLDPLRRAGVSEIGVTVIGRDPFTSPTMELVNALRAAGVADIWSAADSRLAADHVRMFVGQKP